MAFKVISGGRPLGWFYQGDGHRSEVPWLFNKQVWAFGGGKSARFYAALLHPEVEVAVLTEHRDGITQVQDMYGSGTHPFFQWNLEELRLCADQADDRLPRLVICTTHPARFQELLQKAETAGVRFPKNTLFYLPHAPNPAVHWLVARGYTVLIADYFTGIGAPVTQGNCASVRGSMGVKEEALMTVLNAASFPGGQLLELARSAVPHLIGHTRCRWVGTYAALALLPTNAILHVAGVLAHVAEALVKSGNFGSDPILQVSTAQEFLTVFHARGLNCQRDIAQSSDVAHCLEGKGFYREMPAVGPDVLMLEISRIVGRIRSKLGLGNDGADIRSHLLAKYRNSFNEVYPGQADQVPFSAFINRNPSYQNPAIVFPIVPGAGVLNTAHRFFGEELPTFVMLHQLSLHLRLPKGDSGTLLGVIQIAQAIAGKVYVNPDGTVGPDAPVDMHPLCTLADWKRYLLIPDRIDSRSRL